MSPETLLRLALPKGRIETGVVQLLRDAGIRVAKGARAYRPALSLPESDAKVLKPRAVVEMLGLGTRDVGFAGGDLVREMDTDLVEVLDTGLDPVRLVLAAPPTLLRDGRLPERRLRCATEYPLLTAEAARRRGWDLEIIPSFGATEVLPPEDADLIVDNTASGATLLANDLEIVATLLTSSTRMLASRRAFDDPALRARIDDLALLLRSVLDARGRVMLELNVDGTRLEEIVRALPCMREPTVAPLYGDRGYAVKAAVPRDRLASLVPELRRLGGSDLAITQVDQLVS